MTAAQWERAETSLQSVILVPVVFLIVFMSFHLAAFFHQSHVAMAIALRGAEISSVSDISSRTHNHALHEMHQLADDLGAELVPTPSVSFHRGSVVVKVMVRVDGAVPFLPKVASAVVRQTQERFVREQDRE